MILGLLLIILGSLVDNIGCNNIRLGVNNFYNLRVNNISPQY